MLARMWGKGNSYSQLVGMKAGPVAMEISVPFSHKVETDLAILILGIDPKNSTYYTSEVLSHPCSLLFDS